MAYYYTLTNSNIKNRYTRLSIFVLVFTLRTSCNCADVADWVNISTFFVAEFHQIFHVKKMLLHNEKMAMCKIAFATH